MNPTPGIIGLAAALGCALNAFGQGPCPEATGPTAEGPVQAPYLAEISGLAASRTNEGILWVHNDSGDRARIYALKRTGETWAIADIDDAQARDWEDMDIGPGPEDGVDYLYIGDIGDNERVYPSITVYRFPEPDLSALAEPDVVNAEHVEAIQLTYPEAPERVFDAEALFVDPRNSDLYMVTKGRGGGPSHVFRVPGPVSAGEHTLEHVTEVDLGSDPSDQVTAGAMTPTGGAVLLRTYGSIRYWPVQKDETVADSVTRTPCELATATEPQGEALCITPDGAHYITISEARIQGWKPPINVFKLKASSSEN